MHNFICLDALKKRINQYVNERGYKAYRKNYHTYEIYEAIIEQKIPGEFFTKETRRDLGKYVKNRNAFKSFYLTVKDEANIIALEKNKENIDAVFDEMLLTKKQFKAMLKEFK